MKINKKGRDWPIFKHSSGIRQSNFEDEKLEHLFDSTKQANLLTILTLFKHLNIQTSKSEGQPYSDTSLYKVSEYSLPMFKMGQWTERRRIKFPAKKKKMKVFKWI